MKAATIFVHHGDSSLLEKCISVKDRAHCFRRMGYRAWSRESKILTRLAPRSKLDAKTESFCKTISANLFILSPKHVTEIFGIQHYLREVDEI
jgi:hypothetical protein